MAMGILGAYGGLARKEISDYLLVGELSLDGGIRGVRGALPIAVEARAKKIRHLIVPEVNAREAAVVSGVNVFPVRSLLDVVNLLNSEGGNGAVPVHVQTEALLNEARQFTVDFKDVRGQQPPGRLGVEQPSCHPAAISCILANTFRPGRLLALCSALAAWKRCEQTCQPPWVACGGLRGGTSDGLTY